MQARTRKPLSSYYRRLFQHYGPQRWWPAQGPFEVAVGAILTQNTAWSNAEKAIRNLKRARLLAPAALRRVPLPKLARLIRPSGCFNIKARRLKAFIRFLFDHYRGSMRVLFREEPRILRDRLLGVNGIGPETADAILLYAGGLPFFVVDAYTRRVFHRHRLLDGNRDYEVLQSAFIKALPKEPGWYNEFHALIVRVGKEHCGRIPDCKGCPLEAFLGGDPPRIL